MPHMLVPTGMDHGCTLEGGALHLRLHACCLRRSAHAYCSLLCMRVCVLARLTRQQHLTGAAGLGVGASLPSASTQACIPMTSDDVAEPGAHVMRMRAGGRLSPAMYIPGWSRDVRCSCTNGRWCCCGVLTLIESCQQ